jgi:hypothetical protein
MIDQIQDQQIVIDETLVLLRKISQEHLIPKTFACANIAYFCAASLQVLYKNKGMEIPEALTEFINLTYKQVLEDHKDLIEEQYLGLNTHGSC